MSSPTASATPTSSSGNDYYIRINAIGAITLSLATLIAGVYLLVSLARQGSSKLRVRLLLGMVISDIVLGVVVLPSEIAYLMGQSFKTDSPECDAFAFLLTTALFSQHLWTLLIAIVTFLLLKYPLSRPTRMLERFSWWSWPVIWGVSALHSGLWYRRYGFVSTGNLCYYASAPIRPDPSLLVQFIPRAFVFIAIIILYSMLFNFLRRPDTIQISSHFGQEIVTRPDEQEAELEERPRMPRFLLSGSKRGSDAVKDERPPWEKLEFVHVGNRTFNDPQHTPLESPDYLPESRGLSVTVSDSDQSGPTVTDSAEVQKLPILAMSGHASPVLSDKDGLETPFEERDADIPAFVDEQQRDRQNSQSLAEFFQQYQITTDVEEDTRGAQRTSAAQYFNRQASLLMLYFPLAYMLVFSASLVRLVYGLSVPGPPNQILAIISSWFVLSVGFIDGLVYGLVELVVRRRVRRKMPDRM